MEFGDFLSLVGDGIPEGETKLPSNVVKAEQALASMPHDFFVSARRHVMAVADRNPNLTPTECYMVASYYVGNDVFAHLRKHGKEAALAAVVAETARTKVLLLGLSDRHRSRHDLPLLPIGKDI